MSITCNIPDAALRLACRLDDAGASAATIARTLNDEGHTVPRQTVAHHALLRYPHGYAFATDNASIGRWTAESVAELLGVAVAANRASVPLPAVRTHELTVA